MPIYEYVCIKCRRSFGVLQRVGSSEKDTTCPECGSGDVKKKLSAFCCSRGGDAPAAPSYPRFGGGGG